ncbi:biosynthetic peptidoglycan transglycosylase [Streptomyces sp. NPDC058251]|uniref:biosynthetic peptidoglycan transglycosylase n=1 Tax=unclassified Streptomyces TaxID=2593676 RepID=UPI0036F0FA70
MALAACVALAALTPGVGGAEQRAAAIDRTHHVVGPATAVPTRFATALIATEDSRFYSHPGIDVLSAGRTAVAALIGSVDQGGATLEQQLAKQLYYGGQDGGVTAKAGQATLAVKLDAGYSKRQVLQMYAAVVYFGDGFYGLDAASHGYFGVSPDHLTWGQAALLAGLVQAPSAYDPVNHPSLAASRRSHVLNRLVATGYLSAAEAAAAAVAPLHLVAGNNGA